eukprot:TRINITY_DN1793_c0_g2_i3.p1 TRINITY_DN1793_c0_g2~~TRINITY_DN1793_c0_g2_i3.p1  ORF type:complete len:1264 (+),score=310.88 TRINITY_DN1793_c0_g2_i3:75-3794(+)
MVAEAGIALPLLPLPPAPGGHRPFQAPRRFSSGGHCGKGAAGFIVPRLPSGHRAQLPPVPPPLYPADAYQLQTNYVVPALETDAALRLQQPAGDLPKLLPAAPAEASRAAPASVEAAATPPPAPRPPPHPRSEQSNPRPSPGIPARPMSAASQRRLQRLVSSERAKRESMLRNWAWDTKYLCLLRSSSAEESGYESRVRLCAEEEHARRCIGADAAERHESAAREMVRLLSEPLMHAFDQGWSDISREETTARRVDFAEVRAELRLAAERQLVAKRIPRLFDEETRERNIAARNAFVMLKQNGRHEATVGRVAAAEDVERRSVAADEGAGARGLDSASQRLGLQWAEERARGRGELSHAAATFALHGLSEDGRRDALQLMEQGARGGIALGCARDREAAAAACARRCAAQRLQRWRRREVATRDARSVRRERASDINDFLRRTALSDVAARSRDTLAELLRAENEAAGARLAAALAATEAAEEEGRNDIQAHEKVMRSQHDEIAEYEAELSRILAERDALVGLQRREDSHRWAAGEAERREAEQLSLQMATGAEEARDRAAKRVLKERRRAEAERWRQREELAREQADLLAQQRAAERARERAGEDLRESERRGRGQLRKEEAAGRKPAERGAAGIVCILAEGGERDQVWDEEILARQRVRSDERESRPPPPHPADVPLPDDSPREERRPPAWHSAASVPLPDDSWQRAAREPLPEDSWQTQRETAGAPWTVPLPADSPYPYQEEGPRPSWPAEGQRTPTDSLAGSRATTGASTWDGGLPPGAQRRASKARRGQDNSVYYERLGRRTIAADEALQRLLRPVEVQEELARARGECDGLDEHAGLLAALAVEASSLVMASRIAGDPLGPAAASLRNPSDDDLAWRELQQEVAALVARERHVRHGVEKDERFERRTALNRGRSEAGSAADSSPSSVHSAREVYSAVTPSPMRRPTSSALSDSASRTSATAYSPAPGPPVARRLSLWGSAEEIQSPDPPRRVSSSQRSHRKSVAQRAAAVQGMVGIEIQQEPAGRRVIDIECLETSNDLYDMPGRYTVWAAEERERRDLAYAMFEHWCDAEWARFCRFRDLGAHASRGIGAFTIAELGERGTLRGEEADAARGLLSDMAEILLESIAADERASPTRARIEAAWRQMPVIMRLLGQCRDSGRTGVVAGIVCAQAQWRGVLARELRVRMHAARLGRWEEAELQEMLSSAAASIQGQWRRYRAADLALEELGGEYC